MRIRFVIFVTVLTILGGAHAHAVTLFDFQAGTEGWSGAFGGSVAHVNNDGALSTTGSLRCSAAGSGFGCESPEIVNGGFSGLNALILYRDDGNGNLRDRMEVWVTDDAGDQYMQTAVWAKQDWSELVITPFDLEWVQGLGNNPGVPIDLNAIDRIRLHVPASVDGSTTEFSVDEIHLVTLTPNSTGPFAPTVTVNANATPPGWDLNPSGTISDGIYGVNLAFWDNQMGFKGNGNYGAGWFIDTNADYEEQVIDVWEKNYIELTNKAGLRQLRFPGGLQANHYWWKDYVGPVEGVVPNIRKGTTNVFGNNRLTLWFAMANFPYKNRAAIGVDEFLKWCEDLDAEPLLQINVTDAVEGFPGFLPCSFPSGTDLTQLAQLAADLVEFCNAPDDGVDYGSADLGNDGINWAAKRAEYGHKAPYDVTKWEFGNELWTCYNPLDYGNVMATIIDAMEKRQSEIDGNNPVDARAKMYCIAVDNGGGGAHAFTDDVWYSTILGATGDRIDSWARHAYVNTGDSPGPPPTGTIPNVSGIRLGNDADAEGNPVSIDLTVDFPEGGDWRFWTYLVAVTNGQGTTPQLDFYLDGDFNQVLGAYGGTGDADGLLSTKPAPPSERFLDIPIGTASTHTIHLRPNGCYISPNGGVDDPDSQYIAVFPVIKAVNKSSGTVLALNMNFDDEYAMTWTTAQLFSANNFVEPFADLAGKGVAITEWNHHLSIGGNDFKYLTDEPNYRDNGFSDESKWGVTHNGDTIMSVLGLSDFFFKFAEFGVEIASFHSLYEDTNQFGMIEGVSLDSYTPKGGEYLDENDVPVPDLEENWEIGALDRPDDARLRPAAMLFSMFSPNYVGTAVDAYVTDSPLWEVEWTNSFIADDSTISRMGIGALSAGNWESGSNGNGYGFATGSAGGTLAGPDGSGKTVDTISVGSAMPDGLSGEKLNVFLINKENVARTITVNVQNFTPASNAETLVLGVDASGVSLPDQTGTDPINDWTVGMAVQEGSISNASTSFSYTLPRRTIHVIKLHESGADVTAPPAPASITADGTVNGNTEMWLSWPASADPQGDLAGYNVYRSRSQNGPYNRKVNSTGLVAGTSVQDTAVDMGDLRYAGGGQAQWAYAVAAVDDDGNESAFSPVALPAKFGSVVTGQSGSGSSPASQPSPANNATDVSVSAQLSWAAGAGADSHDVYFGTSNPPAFVGNQTQTTYNPGVLANSTTYYWRIDEVNTCCTTTGSVWSFTTESAGMGNESLHPGSVTFIVGNSGDSVSDMATSDDSHYVVNSAIAGFLTTSTDWYGVHTITGNEANVTQLDFTYEGKYSRSRSQSLWVYNFTSNQWTQFDFDGSVGTADEVKQFSITSGEADYIENGQIRFRVVANGLFLGSYTCSADEMTVDVTY